METSHCKFSFKSLLTAVFLGLSLFISDRALAAGEERKIDEKADSLLREASEYLRGTKQFIVKADVSYDEVLPTGQKLQFGERLACYVRRPDRLRAETVGRKKDRLFWYNGETINLLDHVQQTYAQAEAPGSIDRTLDLLVDRYGLSLPMSDLVISDPYESLMRSVKTGSYMGLDIVRAWKCHHLVFTQENIDWQLWIEDGEEFVPRKLVITYKNEPGEPQYVAHFDEWKMSVVLPDALFEPPVGKALKSVEFQGRQMQKPQE